jgi:hypothetical protein
VEFLKLNPQVKILLELHCLYIRPRKDVRLGDFFDYLWQRFNIFNSEMQPYTPEMFCGLYSSGGAHIVLTPK